MRINVDASDKFVALLERLQKHSDSSRRSVLMSGLLHLEWFLEQTSQGRIVVAIDREDCPKKVHQLISEYGLPVVASEQKEGVTSP